MRILVIDDHQMLCVALSEHLERIASQVFLTSVSVTSLFKLADGIAAVKADDPQYNLVFLDLSLDGPNKGIDTFIRFQEGNVHGVPVVIFTGLSLSDRTNVETLRECVFLSKRKALGLLLKCAEIDAAFIGLKRLLNGERWISEELLDAIGGPGPEPGGYRAHLTPRQLDVARCLARGLQDRQIARELQLSPLFVRQVTGQIYKKLSVKNRGGAVGVLERDGYLTSSPPLYAKSIDA